MEGGDDHKKTGEQREDAPVNLNRRTLTKASLGAPVLMTLASRPVLGTQIGRQCTGSVLASSDTTSIPIDWGSCGGCSPGYWKQVQHFCNWPAGVNATDSFGSLFGLGIWHTYKPAKAVMMTSLIDLLQDSSGKVGEDALLAIKPRASSTEKAHARALAKFARAAISARFNATIIGVLYPQVITNSGVPSVDEVNSMVTDVFGTPVNVDIAATYTGQLFATWDGTEESTCDALPNPNCK